VGGLLDWNASAGRKEEPHADCHEQRDDNNHAEHQSRYVRSTELSDPRHAKDYIQQLVARPAGNTR